MREAAVPGRRPGGDFVSTSADPRRYAPGMTLFSRRLPHVLTHADLASLLAPTYAREAQVSEELARERVGRALERRAVADRIYRAVSDALRASQGGRTEDALMDAISKKVQKRLGAMDAAPASPELAAVIVLINVEINLAPAELRATLESDKGKKLLDQGFRALGEFLVERLR